MKTIQNISIEWPQTKNPKQNGFSTIDEVITHKETTLTIEHIVAYEVIKRLLENKSIVRLNYEIDGEVKRTYIKIEYESKTLFHGSNSHDALRRNDFLL